MVSFFARSSGNGDRSYLFGFIYGSNKTVHFILSILFYEGLLLWAIENHIQLSASWALETRKHGMCPLNSAGYQYVLHIKKNILMSLLLNDICPVGLGCRIHRLRLCSGVRPPQRMFCTWHKTIWWWGSSDAGVWGSVEYPFIAIAPRYTLGWSGGTW